MTKKLIYNARIINEGKIFNGSVLIDGEFISRVYHEIKPEIESNNSIEYIDAQQCYLIPGAIDDQVHFRDPGLTYKGDMESESRAAIAGGVTSFMDMPNTKPQTVTIDNLNWKFDRAAQVSRANYSFFFGGTNDNIDQINQLDRSRVPGLKLFLGSSTGNMLVDNERVLEKIFGDTGLLIAIHAEDEEVIKYNKAFYTDKFGNDLDVTFHNKIRSEEACYKSSSKAVELATKLDARLHILHLSTAKELSLLRNDIPLKDKRITGEVCVHHLWFHDEDYQLFGNRIKWNPSIKTLNDREALRNAVNNNTIDIVATDHAPHLLSEKEGNCLTAASGGPLVQHSLIIMFELAMEGKFSYEKVVEKMAHMPADLFRIEKRGYIREGYYADLVLIDPHKEWTVSKENILYKCGWSPFEGYTFHNVIKQTYINGDLAYNNGVINENIRGKELKFD